MQIVINIDEEDYKGICHLRNEQLQMLPVEVAETLIRIANGTPLSKGHGRLIDESKIAVIIETEDGDDFITDAPTIIEADKEN